MQRLPCNPFELLLTSVTSVTTCMHSIYWLRMLVMVLRLVMVLHVQRDLATTTIRNTPSCTEHVNYLATLLCCITLYTQVLGQVQDTEASRAWSLGVPTLDLPVCCAYLYVEVYACTFNMNSAKFYQGLNLWQWLECLRDRAAERLSNPAVAGLPSFT